MKKPNNNNTSKRNAREKKTVKNKAREWIFT